MRGSTDFHWETLTLHPKLILDKYFSYTLRRGRCGDFVIKGVPAACMIYNQRTRLVPKVREFRLNKGLLLLFDAGTQMRQTLRRHPHIDMRQAQNRDDFFLF